MLAGAILTVLLFIPLLAVPANAIDLDAYYVKGWFMAGYVNNDDCLAAVWDGIRIVVYKTIYEYKYGYGDYLGGGRDIRPVSPDSEPGMHNVSFKVLVNGADKTIKVWIYVDGALRDSKTLTYTHQLPSPRNAVRVEWSYVGGLPAPYIIKRGSECPLTHSRYMYYDELFKIKNAEITLAPGEEKDVYLEVYNPLGRVFGYPILEVKTMLNKYTDIRWVEVDPKWLWKEVAPGIKFSLNHYHVSWLTLEHGINKLKVKIKADNKDYIENVKLRVRLKMLHAQVSGQYNILSADVPLYSNVVSIDTTSSGLDAKAAGAALLAFAMLVLLLAMRRG